MLQYATNPLMIFKDWHEWDQLLLIYIQYWNRKQFYCCCAVAAMDHVLTGTLPSNYSQQPMRIKDSSAVHSSDVLLAVSKCLLHIIELVDKEWAHPWSEWAHPLSMNEHIPVSGFRVLSLPSAGNKHSSEYELWTMYVCLQLNLNPLVCLVKKSLYPLISFW